MERTGLGKCTAEIRRKENQRKVVQAQAPNSGSRVVPVKEIYRQAPRIKAKSESTIASAL